MAKKSAEVKRWSAEVLERWEQPGTSNVLVAQRLTAPDGKKFLGVRKLALKANGDEIYTSSGFSVPDDPGSAKMLKKLSGMFKRLAYELEPTETGS